MIDYTAILSANYPDTQWTLNGDTYDGLTWLSDTPKPSQAELDSQWAAVQKAVAQAVTDKATAKRNLLDRLGITADEAQLLLG